MKFNFVLRFSHNQFFCKQSTVLSPFLPHDTRYRPENFSHILHIVWRRYFIYFEQKFLLVKNKRFLGCVRYFNFLFKGEKYSPRIRSHMCKKLFSLIERSISEKRDDKWGHFDFNILWKATFENFEFMRTFALPMKICLLKTILCLSIPLA